MTAPLTLLVFLKDRVDFTKRLVNYLSEVNYPYPVYFADGSTDDNNNVYIKSLTSEKFAFTYKRYPKDSTLSDFYKKCYDAVCDIHTPYIVVADNDDFPVPEGQSSAVDFLEKNPKFVGCNGRVLGVSIFPDSALPYGKNILFHSYYCQTMDVPTKLDQTNSIDRIHSYLTHFYSIYYSVFRTQSLRITYSLVKELDFSDLGIHELFLAICNLCRVKYKRLTQ